MKLEYDDQADAIYVRLSGKPYAYGIELDDCRRVDYSSDGSPVGIELLCVSDGVNLGRLPCTDELNEALRTSGVKTYTTDTGPGYSGLVFDVDFVLRSLSGAEKPFAGLKEEVTV